MLVFIVMKRVHVQSTESLSIETICDHFSCCCCCCCGSHRVANHTFVVAICTYTNDIIFFSSIFSLASDHQKNSVYLI